MSAVDDARASIETWAASTGSGYEVEHPGVAWDADATAYRIRLDILWGDGELASSSTDATAGILQGTVRLPPAAEGLGYGPAYRVVDAFRVHWQRQDRLTAGAMATLHFTAASGPVIIRNRGRAALVASVPFTLDEDI